MENRSKKPNEYYINKFSNKAYLAGEDLANHIINENDKIIAHPDFLEYVKDFFLNGLLITLLGKSRNELLKNIILYKAGQNNLHSFITATIIQKGKLNEQKSESLNEEDILFLIKSYEVTKKQSKKAG